MTCKEPAIDKQVRNKNTAPFRGDAVHWLSAGRVVHDEPSEKTPASMLLLLYFRAAFV
jgi:hypothetical protein